jgi:hypothetical protein
MDSNGYDRKHCVHVEQTIQILGYTKTLMAYVYDV